MEAIMRNRMLLLAGALVAAFSTTSYAQATLPQPTEPRELAAASFSGRLYGNVDFGGRFTSVDGDPARYERYRDLRDGPFAQNFSLSRRGEDWTLDAFATNMGYRDQRYSAEYRSVGKLKVGFLWDQIPLFISSDTRTLYTELQPGIFRLEDVMQTNNELRTTTIRDYTDQAAEFELRTKREIGVLDVVFNATRDLDLKFNVTSTGRKGAIPHGATFGFNNLVELPVPIDQRTTDATTLLEWANEDGLVSVGWDGSWFDNHIETLIWDNPLKINDSPSYPSAYSDGRGPSQARMALWPTNTQQYVHATGSIVTAGRGRLTGYLAAGVSRQNATLLPHTINAQIPVIPLERSTAEAEIRNTMFNVQYSARPLQEFGVIARYRYADIDNRTPHFETLGRVRFDGALDDAANSPEPEPYSVKRKNFDVDGTFSVLPLTSVKVGYGNAITDRTFRVLEETTEHTFRASVDATGNQYASVRGLFEVSSREGDQLNLHVLDGVGEQPTMRHFDIADRDRTRFTVIATANPTAIVGLSGSIGIGRDDFPASGFGLQSYDSNQYSVGIDVIPNDRVGFNLVYAWEDYASLTQSRSAAPPPAVTFGALEFEDPRRDWFTDYDGKVKNIDATLDIAELAPRTNLRVNVNWSDADDVYTYQLTSDSVLPAPQQLAPVVNELLRSTIDLSYRVNNNLRVGAGYWFEKYDVEDFALGPLTISDIALPPVQPGFPIVATNSLLLGYIYRPYTAHTGWVRLTYMW
jgi:MtrB/PioB family decaheme-associated outer membrane protein